MIAGLDFENSRRDVRRVKVPNSGASCAYVARQRQPIVATVMISILC